MKNTNHSSFRHSHVHYVYNDEGIQVHKEDIKATKESKNQHKVDSTITKQK